MRAWNCSRFDNDDALDWSHDFEKEPSVAFIEKTLRVASDAGDDYLEADDASRAVAAAEVVAALRGAPRPQPPSTITELFRTRQITVEHSLVSLALDALERVRTDSELQVLWEEGDVSSWRAAINDLESRLRQGA